MAKTKDKTIYQLVGEYANTVGQFGPNSQQVRQFRANHANNHELIDYANALDRLKRHLSGRGRKNSADKAAKATAR